MAIGCAVVLLIIFGSWAPPDHSASSIHTPDGYEFTIQNEADQPVAYSLTLAGILACEGELPHQWWKDKATCTSRLPYDGTSRTIVLSVQWDSGRRAHITGETTGSTTYLTITNFGASTG